MVCSLNHETSDQLVLHSTSAGNPFHLLRHKKTGLLEEARFFLSIKPVVSLVYFCKWLGDHCIALGKADKVQSFLQVADVDGGFRSWMQKCFYFTSQYIVNAYFNRFCYRVFQGDVIAWRIRVKAYFRSIPDLLKTGSPTACNKGSGVGIGRTVYVW